MKHIINALTDLQVLEGHNGKPWELVLTEKSGAEISYSFAGQVLRFRVTPLGTAFEVEVEEKVATPSPARCKMEIRDPNIQYAIGRIPNEGRLEVVGASDIILYLQFSENGKSNDLFLLAENDQHTCWLA